MSMLFHANNQKNNRNKIMNYNHSNSFERFNYRKSHGSIQIVFAVIMSIFGGLLCAYSLSVLINSDGDIFSLNDNENAKAESVNLAKQQNENMEKSFPIKFAQTAILPVAQEAPKKIKSSKVNHPKKDKKLKKDDPNNDIVKKYQNPPKITSKPLILGSSKKLTDKQLSTIKKEKGRRIQALPQIEEENVTAIINDPLVTALEAALKDVEYKRSVKRPVGNDNFITKSTNDNNDNLPDIEQLPFDIQKQIPTFSVLAHVYASTPNRRWLNIDGKELQQGDLLYETLTISEIRPRDIVLEFDGVKFKVPAF